MPDEILEEAKKQETQDAKTPETDEAKKPESDKTTEDTIAEKEDKPLDPEEVEKEPVDKIAESTAPEVEPEVSPVEAKLDRLTDLVGSLVEALTPDAHYVEPKPEETKAETPVNEETEDIDDVINDLNI